MSNSQQPSYPSGLKTVPPGVAGRNTGVSTNKGTTSTEASVNSGINVNSRPGQAVNINQQGNNVNGAVNKVNGSVRASNVPTNNNVNSNGERQRFQMPQMTPQQQQQFRQLAPHQQQQYLQQLQHQQNQQRLQTNMTPEQLERYKKLTPEQKKMLMVQQFRRKARTQVYYESNEELLEKFKAFPPSIEFHIHENHYRFGNQDSIIPKNSSTVKQFLEYVAKGEIPEAFVEVIKDGGIRLYDGNLILKVLDHRLNDQAFSNQSQSEQQQQQKKQQSISTNVSDSNNNSSNTNTASSPTTDHAAVGTPAPGENKAIAKATPKEYRTILRSTQLSQYDDLSYQSDANTLADQFAISFEGEILTATNRNINLQPVLNPFLINDEVLKPSLEIAKPYYDSEKNKMVFPHRVDARGNDVNVDNFEYRKLHEDLPHLDSKYEQIMNILTAKYSNNSNLNDQANEETGQFQRLRIIEMWRRKYDNLKKQVNMTSNFGNGGNSGFEFGNSAFGANGTGGFMNSDNNPLGGMTQQQRALINKERMTNQRQKEQMAAAVAAQFPNSRAASSNGVNAGADGTASAGPNGTAAQAGTPGATDGKKAPKKPRKPTKKQLAAQAAAVAQGGSPTSGGSTPVIQHQSVAGKTVPGQAPVHSNISGKTVPGQSEEPPKKKRTTYKKKKADQ